MRLINNILYLTFAEMVDCGVSENYLRKAKSTGTKCWTFIDDPDDKRRVLIEYSSLKDEYKKKAEARFGDPYERVAKQPIRDLIKWDNKAEEFYLGYRYASGDMMLPLPIAHVKKYTGAANFLNMLKQVTDDKKALKDLLKLNLEQFYLHALEIIEKDEIDLPTSYRRLLAKRKEYEANGYAALISWKFGNQAAAKVKDELSQSTLLEMIAHPNQYDDVFIMMQYNKWAKENGYKVIDVATVGNWRRKTEGDTVAYREGNAALRNKFLKVAKGFRPTQPLHLVESDDNQLDLLFEDPENPKGTRRYVAMVVTDSFNDYVLGYAYALIGELEKDQTIHLVKAAYLNAMYYVKSLTNGWHLPGEVKTDRWGLKQLQPFYEAIGKYYPTPVGSKNRGYLEQFFGNVHWKRCLKIGANNYTGNNITAHYRGVNTEVVAANKKNRPLIGNEAITQIENFFHRLRHLPQSNGQSKHQQWMQAFEKMENKRLINDEQFLLKFGIEHNHLGEGLRITNKGVQPIINGVKYNYDLAEYEMSDINKRVSVLYDPYDMSHVLVTDFGGVRKMAYDARLNPRALEDCRDTDSRLYLNATLNEKRDQVGQITAKAERRKLVMTSAGYDAETLLQANVMVKELKQKSESKMLVQTIDANDDYLNQL
jgi:hypothetical protein